MQLALELSRDNPHNVDMLMFSRLANKNDISFTDIKLQPNILDRFKFWPEDGAT